MWHVYAKVFAVPRWNAPWWDLHQFVHQPIMDQYEGERAAKAQRPKRLKPAAVASKMYDAITEDLRHANKGAPPASEIMKADGSASQAVISQATENAIQRTEPKRTSTGNASQRASSDTEAFASAGNQSRGRSRRSGALCRPCGYHCR